MTLASEKSSVSKREFELAQWNLTKISKHNSNMLQEDIKKLSTDLNAARKRIANMSALPSFMKSKIENKLNETSWPDNCMEACAPAGCAVCNEEVIRISVLCVRCLWEPCCMKLLYGFSHCCELSVDTRVNRLPHPVNGVFWSACYCVSWLRPTASVTNLYLCRNG